MPSGQDHIKALAWLMHHHGIRHVVVSPGSRNAPAIILFSESGFFKLHSIVDERSAGFFAMGMAMRLQNTVALLCTSGTAALNYAPALAEAYYQQIPLLVITADRPEQWIDQGDGQTIRQRSVFRNFIRKSFHLSFTGEHDGRYVSRVINQAVACTRYPVPGPVHVNLPLEEPLYDIDLPVGFPSRPVMKYTETGRMLPEEIFREWRTFSRKMILAGQKAPDKAFADSLSVLASDPSVVILTETTTNVFHPDCIGCIDRVIEGMEARTEENFKPELLITFSGAVISKKIKSLLREMRPMAHWHISPDPEAVFTDTYQALTRQIPLSEIEFLQQIAARLETGTGDYRDVWQKRRIKREILHNTFISGVPFSDLWVYHHLLLRIPADQVIHLGNSTPVRYAQLFDPAGERYFFGNRGTSGIDGCVSTAAGYAFDGITPVTVITGDIGFLYDSHSLWNSCLSPSLTVILINNRGGNIFRILEGPSNFKELEPFIETRHELAAEGICRTFGVEYQSAHDPDSLSQALDTM